MRVVAVLVSFLLSTSLWADHGHPGRPNRIPQISTMMETMKKNFSNVLDEVEWLRASHFRILPQVWKDTGAFEIPVYQPAPQGAATLPVSTSPEYESWEQGFVYNVIFTRFPDYREQLRHEIEGGQLADPNVSVPNAQHRTADFWVSVNANTAKTELTFLFDIYNQFILNPMGLVQKPGAPEGVKIPAHEALVIQSRKFDFYYKQFLGSIFFYVEAMKRSWFFTPFPRIHTQPIEMLVEKLKSIEVSSWAIFEQMHDLRPFPEFRFILEPCWECTFGDYFQMSMLVNEPLACIPFPYFDYNTFQNGPRGPQNLPVQRWLNPGVGIAPQQHPGIDGGGQGYPPAQGQGDPFYPQQPGQGGQQDPYYQGGDQQPGQGGQQDPSYQGGGQQQPGQGDGGSRGQVLPPPSRKHEPLRQNDR